MSADPNQGGSSAAPGAEQERKEPTNYMVLWAELPAEYKPGDRLAWNEIGWYESHSAPGAAVAAREDAESGAYAAMFDAGKRGGVKIRAIAKRSWPDDVDTQAITLRPEWTTGKGGEA